jgi:transposase, IS605 OrfB family, central region
MSEIDPLDADLLRQPDVDPSFASNAPGPAVATTDGGVITLVTTARFLTDDDVNMVVGVDFGERVLWAAAVVGPDGVKQVEMESGREFRHYREQLDRRREQLSEQGDLRGIRETRGDRERYTEQKTHTATRRIVDLAAEHAPCKIRYEDLTDYRETADDAIHDWPHGMLTEQLAYKATEAGLPVEAIDPANTSITCRQCGETNPQFRDQDDFECWECGYEVHADVNAAINIAQWT